MIKVGQRLRNERIKRGLNLDEISQATKIKPSFLLAIEEGNYKKLPSSAYIKGFLKNYAQFLGLPYKDILAIFKREFNEKESLEVMPEGVSGKNEITTNSFRISSSSVVFVFVLAVIGYVLFQYRAFVIGPYLDVYSPKEGQVIGKSIIVKGKTDPNASLFINGRPVPVGQDGTFQKEIRAFPGNETIDIVSENHFGKKTENYYHLRVKG
ncbi:helix-turn-helix domain-containing protein [Patescibacteria group bacterium]|nr:helix-turn-helix domain-containing protein [Patescibacteria group bacterium]MCL5009992.1 helix-turn-helix domain-containing protein [Patescibacteria group bacterium]